MERIASFQTQREKAKNNTQNGSRQTTEKVKTRTENLPENISRRERDIFSFSYILIILRWTRRSRSLLGSSLKENHLFVHLRRSLSFSLSPRRRHIKILNEDDFDDDDDDDEDDDDDSDDSEGEFADEGDWYASLIVEKSRRVVRSHRRRDETTEE